MVTFSGIMDKCNYGFSSGNYSSFESNMLDLYSAFHLPSEEISRISDNCFILNPSADYYPESVGSLDKLNKLASLNQQYDLEVQVSKTK